MSDATATTRLCKGQFAATLATSRRQELICELLEWRSAINTAETGQGSGDNGDRLLLPHPAYTAAFRELDTCLSNLRNNAPKQYRHLAAVFDAPTKPVRVPIKVKDKHGKTRTVTPDQPNAIVYAAPTWVRLEQVRRAIATITNTYRGEPCIPRELLAAA